MKITFAPETIWQILGTEYCPLTEEIGDWRQHSLFPTESDIKSLKEGRNYLTLSAMRDASSNLASTQEGYENHGFRLITRTWDVSNLKYINLSAVFEVEVSEEWVTNWVSAYNQFPGKVYSPKDLVSRIKDTEEWLTSQNREIGRFRWYNAGSAWAAAKESM